MSFDADKYLVAFQGKMTRYVLLAAAIFISVVGYSYVVEFYDPNKNFLLQIWRGIFKESYFFYSGSPGGFYIQIGKHLEQETRAQSSIRIQNKTSSGAKENATKVMNTGASFGLIQEDTLLEKDFIRDHIEMITPMYIERMHVLYNAESFKTIVGNNTDAENRQAVHISANGSSKIIEFFENAKISTGPQGSGSKIFAGYLMDAVGVEGIDDRSLGFSDGLEGLEEGELDVVFSIAGAPLPRVSELLEQRDNDERIELMGIDPSVVQAINRKWGLRLRSETFRGKYEGGEKISTIGSYSFLIASKDTPNSAIMEVLSVLDSTKHKMPGYNQEDSPLNEFDYLQYFEQIQESYTMDLLRNFFLFVVSVALTSSLAMGFLVWIVSGFKQVNYFRNITRTYTEYLPENSNLDEQKRPFPRPIIYENQSEIIAKLVRGVSYLIVLAQDVRKDYESGGLTVNHYKHLLDNIYQIRGIFHRNLFQRLHEVLEDVDAKAENGHEIDRALLRHYHTAGYLDYEGYKRLAQLLPVHEAAR